MPPGVAHVSGHSHRIRWRSSAPGPCRIKHSHSGTAPAGLALPAPHLPTLLTNDFASRRLGRRVWCDAGSPADAATAAACRDAHSQVALWSGGASFASNACLALVTVPWLGRLSDDRGRRPFLALAALCTLGVVGVVLAHQHLGLHLTWYYVAQVRGMPGPQ